MTGTLAESFDVALLDLDGVVYIGDHAVPGAVAALAAARDLGMHLAFVTNNASRPPAEVADHLSALGIAASPEEVVTSAQAGAAVLAGLIPPGSAVLAVGGPGVSMALDDHGLRPVRADGRTDEEAEVQGVLQGFGRDVGWRDLAAAALAVQRGAVWIVTNPDRTFPVPGGRAPGNGSLAAAVEAAAGRPPHDIAGKPFPALMRASIERTGARRPLVVGDRLDTDIAGAAHVGIPALLVLTGICDIAGLLAAEPGERPDFVGADLGALVRPPAATGQHAGGPRQIDGWWVHAGARARVRSDSVEVEFGPGDWLAGVQCACAAAWSEPSARVTAAAHGLEAARRSVST
jgi:HAD superfamily hydrolase (TIGR01450 family)